jgi:hypothetical protein
MSKRSPLVCQHLENISRDALDHRIRGQACDVCDLEISIFRVSGVATIRIAKIAGLTPMF